MPKVIKKIVKVGKKKTEKKIVAPKKTIKKSKKIKDTDGDGLSDFDEINIFGSDPNNADSNGDGLEDGEAVLQGLDPVSGNLLKDFFIPYAGNDYQPQALKPQRILFHAAAALAVKAIVIFFVATYPLLAWMTPDIAAAEGQKIIALTNNLRSSLSLSSLLENQKLNAAAAQKVDDMFINQYFAHVSPHGYDLEHFLALAGYNNYAVVGENLAMGYSSATEAMTAWGKSPTHYANLIDTNYSQIGVALAGGVYSGTDTFFIAQYFGLPQTAAVRNLAPAASTETTSIETIEEPNPSQNISAGEQAVLAAEASGPSEPASEPAQGLSLPVLTREEAKITVVTPTGQPDTKVIKVEAVLPIETKGAVAQVENTNIILAPIATSDINVSNPIADPDETLWVGQGIATNQPGENSSIVPPIILATDNAGNTAQVLVAPGSIKAQPTSLLDQYVLFKTHPNQGLARIFEASSIYFKILLGLVMIILVLNIFIQIKKQRPKLIMSGVGLVLLLGLLIVF